jgi:hypothetical protein
MAAKKILNNTVKSKKKKETFLKTEKTRLKSVKSNNLNKNDKFKALKEKKLENNKNSSKIEKKNNKTSISSANKDNNRAANVKSGVNSAKSTIISSSQTKNNALISEKNVPATKGKQNTNETKKTPYETVGNIILLKRKMHREIFQRCLERKLLSGMDVWDERDRETSVDN